MQQSSHDIENCCFSNILLFLRVKNQRGVARHKEMTSRRWDQRGDQTHQIVVHIPWVPESGSSSAHNGRHDRVGLSESWLSELESVSSHSCQSCIVNNYGSIRVQDQSLRTQ